jgi:hypothetical protein
MIIVFCAGCESTPHADAQSDSTRFARARVEMTATAESLRKAFAENLRHDVDSLETARKERLVEIERLNGELERSFRGLPGSVTLDSLNAYYAQRWNEASFSESFETSAGVITFDKPDFNFAYLPSSKEVAFIRIGRTRDSYSSREIIRAWLREATEMKTRQGYRKVYVRSGPAEYGEYTEALYRNGDAYFKTFFRSARVLQTYGRYSLQYDYFVEMGSEGRAERYRTERYNSRLGS